MPTQTLKGQPHLFGSNSPLESTIKELENTENLTIERLIIKLKDWPTAMISRLYLSAKYQGKKDLACMLEEATYGVEKYKLGQLKKHITSGCYMKYLEGLSKSQKRELLTIIQLRGEEITDVDGTDIAQVLMDLILAEPERFIPAHDIDSSHLPSLIDDDFENAPVSHSGKTIKFHELDTKTLI